MPQKHVFVVCERTFKHQDDKQGSLAIDSVHTTIESANRWALALANNRCEEFEGVSARRKDSKRALKTKWGTTFSETVTTPAEAEFAIEYYVDIKHLEGDELVEDSDREALASIPKTVETRGDFDGMKFSWVGELDDMEARDEIRYLVFDNGGTWQAVEKSIEGPISDYVIAGKNIPPRHQKIIDDKDLLCVNRLAFLKMAKNLGLPKSNASAQPIDPLRCFERMNFAVLGNMEEPGKRLTKTLIRSYGSQPLSSHISEMDYVVRRGSDSPADSQLFEEECRKFLKISNPTIITSKQVAGMILKKIENSLPAENPRLSITSESIKTAVPCLEGLKFWMPLGGGHIEDMNYIRHEGGQILGSVHAMDLADYVVKGTGGFSDEHATMATRFDVKVITMVEVRDLVKRLQPWKTAKDQLGLAMGYLHAVEPKTRKRKATATSISQLAKKSTKLTA